VKIVFAVSGECARLRSVCAMVCLLWGGLGAMLSCFGRVNYQEWDKMEAGREAGDFTCSENKVFSADLTPDLGDGARKLPMRPTNSSFTWTTSCPCLTFSWIFLFLYDEPLRPIANRI